MILEPVVPLFLMLPPILLELGTVSSPHTAQGPASPRTLRGLVILFLPDSTSPATKASPATSIKDVGPWVSQPWFPSLPWVTHAETLTQEEADPPCQRAPACCFLPAARAPPAVLPPIPGVPACLSLCTLGRGSLPASSVLPHPSPSKPGPWGTSLALGRGGSARSPLDSMRVSAAHGLGLPRVGFRL